MRKVYSEWCKEYGHPSHNLSTISPILLYRFAVWKTNRQLFPSCFSKIMFLLWDFPHLYNAVIAILFSYFPNSIFTCMANYWLVELRWWASGGIYHKCTVHCVMNHKNWWKRVLLSHRRIKKTYSSVFWTAEIELAISYSSPHSCSPQIEEIPHNWKILKIITLFPSHNRLQIYYPQWIWYNLYFP